MQDAGCRMHRDHEFPMCFVKGVGRWKSEICQVLNPVSCILNPCIPEPDCEIFGVFLRADFGSIDDLRVRIKTRPGEPVDRSDGNTFEA